MHRTHFKPLVPESSGINFCGGNYLPVDEPAPYSENGGFKLRMGQMHHCGGLGVGEHSGHSSGPGKDSFNMHERAGVPPTLSFWKWCSGLLRNVLRTRTPFAAFLKTTLHLPRSSMTSISPLFPLPIPSPGVFQRMPSSISLHRRRRLHLKRTLHVLVMALNFWHGGLTSFPNEVFLTRHPSKAHRTVYRKLMNALAADGPDSGTFEVLACGRRFPQLVARLGEISDYMTKLGAAGPYSHFYHGHEVPLNNSILPQFQPYMPLDANRLSIKGHGCFDATPHLGDELLMAYRMPDLLLCDRQPQYRDFPIMTDDAKQIIQLAKLWDARGLLFLRRGPVDAGSLTRVLNNFKNEECDRQIGDRRGRNYQEAKVQGPSRHLPAGPDLTDLHLNGRKEALRIYSTDRSDFYHQFAVTDAKAGPSVTADDVADLHAYSEMLSREANERKVKRTREVEGDQLHLLHEPVGKKRASLLNDEIFICFKSFQGDHGGVEFATASHESVLQSQGLLSSSIWLVANRPFNGGSLADGLVIDDYFAISREPRRQAPELSAAARCFSKSQAVYKKYDLIGSPQKDVKGETRARVIGAELNSNDHAARCGITSVGSPIGKRLSLSWVTFQIAQLPATTDSLYLCLLGG